MSDCLFCRLVSGEIPSDKVYEDDEVLAFKDIQPQAPAHMLVIPKTHVPSVAQMTDAPLMGKVMIVAAELARNAGLEDKGYRLVTNIGKDGGQTVDHLHVHLLGGRALQWPPG